MSLKHVGRIAKNQSKVIVAYRVLPNDPDHCLVIPTGNLDADQHDAVIKLVESNAGQTAYELAEAMARTTLPDGRNMLAGLHLYGKLLKVPTVDIEMTPDTKSVVNLAELNQVIATQKGVTVADLAIQAGTKAAQPAETKNEPEPVVQNSNTGVLSDEELAAQYRSQADALYKEAKRLREQAEQLSPTKKKSKESAQQEA